MKREEDSSHWSLQSVVIEVLITLIVALALYPVLHAFFTTGSR